MKQECVRFVLPNPGNPKGNWDGIDARERLAKDLADLPQEQGDFLFHHAPCSGSPAVPAVMWHGGRNSFRLIATGEPAIAVLGQVAGPLVRAVSSLAGGAVPVEFESRKLAFSEGPPHVHVAKRVIVARDNKDIDAYRAASIEERRAIVEQRLRNSYTRWVDTWGIDAPSERALKVLSVGREICVPIRGDRWGLMVYDVDFILPGVMDGFWALGLVTHKGFGRIAAYRQPETPAAISAAMDMEVSGV